MWLKIKVWTKIALFVLLTVYTILFIYKNSQRPAQPWFWFYTEPQTSVLIVSLCAFLIGVLGTILVRTTFRTLTQFREMKARAKGQRIEREVTEMRAKAGMLRTRPVPGASSSAPTSVDDVGS